MIESRFPLSFLFLLGLLFTIGCGGDAKKLVDGEGGGSGGSTSPPLTFATPGGGLYSEGQNVTLSANEPATIYYTTDGVIPTVGGLTTFSAPSPVTNIDTTTGGTPFILRFFAVDTSGQTESIKQAVYTYDLTPPVVLITNTLLNPYGFLDVINYGFYVDEPAFYWFELGGVGSLGSGTLIAQGSVPVANVLNEFEIPVSSLEMNNPSPGLQAYLYVQNQAGGITTIDAHIKTKSEISTAAAGRTSAIELAPDDSYGFLLRPDEGQVWKVDTDPLSVNFMNPPIPISVGGDLRSMRVSANSEKVYITSSAGLYEVDIATEALSATYGLPGGVGCSGIAILPGTNEAILAGDNELFYIMNLASGGSVALNFSQSGMEKAELYQSLDSNTTAIVWSSSTFYGVQILDTNPISLGYLNDRTTILSGFITHPVPQFAFSPNGLTGYTGDTGGRLTSVHLNTSPPMIGESGESASVNGLSAALNGDSLVLSESSLPGLLIGNAETLEVTHLYGTGGIGSAPTSRDVRFDSAGTMLFVVRNNGISTADLLVLPL